MYWIRCLILVGGCIWIASCASKPPMPIMAHSEGPIGKVVCTSNWYGDRFCYRRYITDYYFNY